MLFCINLFSSTARGDAISCFKQNTLLVLRFLSFSFISEELTKCLQNNHEQIRISCPSGHVLYNPRVIAEASVTSDCTRHANDCTGVPRGIERQVAGATGRNTVRWYFGKTTR